MHNNDKVLCQLCASYMLGESSAEEREAFAEHLSSCPSCREELRTMRQVWQMLPLGMEEVSVPADLKEEVMSTIFGDENDQITTKQQDVRTEPLGNGVSSVQNVRLINKKRSFWRYGLISALVPLLVISVIWNIVLLQERDSTPLETPVQIVSLMSFKAAAPAFIASKGMACILQQGDQRRLVVYLYNLPATEGSEAYQVWLLQEGKRSNAGTFRVGDNGFGVLTLNIRVEDQFDAIGVTLEPDAMGTEPRGSKVVGT